MKIQTKYIYVPHQIPSDDIYWSTAYISGISSEWKEYIETRAKVEYFINIARE